MIMSRVDTSTIKIGRSTLIIYVRLNRRVWKLSNWMQSVERPPNKRLAIVTSVRLRKKALLSTCNAAKCSKSLNRSTLTVHYVVATLLTHTSKWSNTSIGRTARHRYAQEYMLNVLERPWHP
jgi:hypothetical protein